MLDQSSNLYRLNNSQLIQALNSAAVTLWSWNVPTREFIINQHGSVLLETDTIACRAHRIEDVIHPDDLYKFENVLDTAFTRDQPFEIEHRLKTEDGHWQWVSTRGTTLEQDQSGNPRHMMGASWDITAHKETTEKLAASEVFYQLLVSNISDTVVITDNSGTFKFICPNIAGIFGYSMDEVRHMGRIEHLLGMDLFEQNPPGTFQEIANIEVPIVDKYGTSHILLVNMKSVSIYNGSILFTCRDISARKRAEDRLKHQSDFQHVLIELATHFINTSAEEFDDAITNALHEVGQFLGSTRCIIGVLDEHFTQVTRAYEWHVPEVRSLQGVTFPILDPHNLLPRLQAGENFVFSDADQVAQFPDLAREMSMIGAEVEIIVPLIREGRLRETVSVSWEHPLPVEPGITELIVILGEIYRNAVDRKERDKKLHLLNLELEQRVHERTIELSEANQRLQVEVVERKQAQEAEHEQRVLAEALHDTAAVLNSTLNLEEVLDHILVNIDRVVKHDIANIILIEADTARIVHYRDYPSIIALSTINTIRFPMSTTPSLNWMASSRKPLLIPEVDDYPGWVKIPEFSWLHSYLGVPICLDDEVIGFLGLYCSIPNFFTLEHAQRLQAFADQAAIAIKNARLYEQANILAAMEERQRLVRELHDSVSQMLFSANTVAESLPLIYDRHPEKLGQYMSNLHNFTRGAMAEMRTLFLELRPDALIQTELGLLLAQLCNAFTGRTQIEVERHISTGRQFLPDIQIAFYRIAQESFNNITKYAQPTKVSLTLNWTKDWLSMAIADNGKGFDPVTVSSEHLGIQIMRERATGVDAEFDIHSNPGVGTEITVRRKLDD